MVSREISDANLVQCTYMGFVRGRSAHTYTHTHARVHAHTHTHIIIIIIIIHTYIHTHRQNDRYFAGSNFGYTYLEYSRDEGT